ncbi:carbonic anhydrase family protein [Liquorilactobacillus capillatus]|uniref:carbonic anhydrase n=1 Tax=Liquorilactobacillus capillatus DSM 19910 TaxID=1423731 RepID=A0A0R1MAZ4_9LACO|nr:carbonic anhydrase family protein [Liquorilactobacillus capillatus]KRL00616.1 carbonate dehydratase [Liquorilactobacillus capillatus DSM 19910]
MLDYQQQNKWEFIASPLQSPIALETKQAEQKLTKQTPLKFLTDYSFESVVSQGNNLQFNGKGTLIANGRNFAFQQLHFHIPAEHLVDGKTYPMEWHFVHQNKLGQNLVVAVFVVIGENNSQLQPFYKDFHLKEKQQQKFTYQLSMMELLKTQLKTAYNYLGSLTTPPLSRGVEWWVLQRPLVIAPEQLAALKKRFNNNAREVQADEERKILLYETTC